MVLFCFWVWFTAEWIKGLFGERWTLNYSQQLWVLVPILSHIHGMSFTMSPLQLASFFTNKWRKKWAPNSAVNQELVVEKGSSKIALDSFLLLNSSSKCIWLVHEETIWVIQPYSWSWCFWYERFYDRPLQCHPTGCCQSRNLISLLIHLPGCLPGNVEVIYWISWNPQ